MTALLNDASPWMNRALVIVYVAIFLFQLMRGLRVLYVDRKMNLKENDVFGNASILPVISVIAVLLGLGLLTVQFPLIGPWLLPAVGVVVLAGTGWSIERGITAVRAYREKQLKIEQRRARIRADREAEYGQISEQEARDSW